MIHVMIIKVMLIFGTITRQTDIVGKVTEQLYVCLYKEKKKICSLVHITLVGRKSKPKKIG